MATGKRERLQRDNLDGKAATVRMVILAVAAGVMIVAAATITQAFFGMRAD